MTTSSPERAPLLDPASDRSRMPWAQLSIICLCRFSEPVCFMMIFPWVQAAILEFGIATSPAQIGYFAGLIESAFGASQFCTVIAWGRLSDRIGRKPVITLGLLGAAFSTILFGLSRSLLTLLASRILMGALSGNAGVLKASLAELTTDETKGRAFALLPATWAIGAAIGPLIGGLLAPSSSLPPLFPVFPFLLPCLVSALFPIAGAIVAQLYLGETLPARNKAVDAPEPSAPPPLRDLLTPKVKTLLLTYAMLAFQTISLAALLPLFAFSPIEDGGLGFSTAEIGTAMSLYGFGGATIQLIFYPPLHARFGTSRGFRLTAGLYPLVFLYYPVISIVAAHGDRRATWIALIVALFVGATANMCYSSVMVLTNDSASQRNALGAVNGLAQSIASAFRALGPIIATSIYAFTIERNILHGYLIFILLSILAIGTSTVALKLDDRVAWRDADDEDKCSATAGRGA